MILSHLVVIQHVLQILYLVKITEQVLTVSGMKKNASLDKLVAIFIGIAKQKNGVLLDAFSKMIFH